MAVRQTGMGYVGADRRALIVAIVSGTVGSALGSLINLFFLPGELVRWRGVAVVSVAATIVGLGAVQHWKHARPLPLRTLLIVVLIGLGGSLWILAYQAIVAIAAQSGYAKWESLVYPFMLYGSQWSGLSVVLVYRELQFKQRIIPLGMFVGSTALIIGAAWLYWFPEGHLPQWPVLIAASVPPVLVILAVCVYLIVRVQPTMSPRATM